MIAAPAPSNPKLIEICTWTENISKEAAVRGWEAIPPISLESGCDLTTPSGRKMAMASLEKNRPDAVVIAWPCTVWANLQNSNIRSEEYAEKLQQERMRQLSILRFVAWLFFWCVSHNVLFVGENPQTSLAGANGAPPDDLAA